MFTPNFGEMIHFDKHSFQMGWNHQVETVNLPKKGNDSLTQFSTCNQAFLNK